MLSKRQYIQRVETDCGSNRHQVLQKANNKVNASNEKQVLSPEVSEKFRQIVADMEDFANVDETDRSAPLGATGKINKPYLICVIKCQIP